MDVLSLLLQLLFRSLFVLAPLCVACLALRRVLRSRSANAWIYGGVCLFSAISAAGMVPWVVGLETASWPLFALSLLSPVLWVGALMICDPAEDVVDYDDLEVMPVWETRRSGAPPARTASEVREVENWDEIPKPVFRHHVPANRPRAPGAELMRPSDDRSMMNVARDMRGHESSERRRPLILPASTRYGRDLPFLPPR